jgi:DNA-binding MltR family transcriptional regulator
MIWIIANENDKSILEEIYKQTDRGAALIAVSYLEQRLLDAIKSRLNNDEKIEDKLFKGSGALATFSSRIDLALLLGIYEPVIHKMLHQIREIRNEFAHEPSPRDFNSQRIKALCDNISISGKIHMENRTDGSRVSMEFIPDGTGKLDFLNAIKYLLALLDMEIKTFPLRKPAKPLFPVPAIKTSQKQS